MRGCADQCIWVHSSVVRAADCRSAGPWFKSGVPFFVKWQVIYASYVRNRAPKTSHNSKYATLPAVVAQGRRRRRRRRNNPTPHQPQTPNAHRDNISRCGTPLTLIYSPQRAVGESRYAHHRRRTALNDEAKGRPCTCQ